MHMSQWKSFLVVALFLVGSGLSGVADADEESRTYPNDWTHRPLVEHFGSLSAVYDMAYAAPAINQLVGDSENDTSNPYNIISFHQTNGGNGDDPFHTEDSKSRMRDHYGQNGVPNVQFDGNYRYVGGGGESNYQDYVEAIEDSGPREGEGNDEPFKIVDLDIYSEFSASDGIGQFEITVDIHYRGQTGGDGGIPTEPGDDDDEYLEGELYVFMVEDSVPAYSSYLDAIWNNRMVFREYAIDDEEFTLAEGGYATFSTVWELPTTQIDGDGVSGDIKIPINPGRMIPIAAVFDRDDTDSGNDQDTMGDDTYPTPRAIQSATPQSTAYDNSLEVSSVSSIQININYEDRVGIGVTFSDNIAISSAYVIYNFDDLLINGEYKKPQYEGRGVMPAFVIRPLVPKKPQEWKSQDPIAIFFDVLYYRLVDLNLSHRVDWQNQHLPTDQHIHHLCSFIESMAQQGPPSSLPIWIPKTDMNKLNHPCISGAYLFGAAWRLIDMARTYR